MKKKFYIQILPVFIILAVTCLIFFKIFIKGLYPVPGDLLVSFYFPWYSGGWEGYDPWTTRKELLGADSIRQIYIWKDFAVRQIKEGRLPLWNPYTFSGQPLLANFQSGVFYPANFFYFLTDVRNAWVLLIVIQPFLGGIFMYMVAKSFKISSVASVFASFAFMFSSYLITWMENGNIAHSYIWLPFALWAINNYFEKFKFRYIYALILSLSLSVLAGHPQTAIYLFMATFLYWMYKTWQSKKARLQYFLLYIFSAVAVSLVSAVQLIPTYSFYKVSPISLPFSKSVFDRAILPYKNLATFFAPDFFGHPASDNFWSQSYGDFTPYFGVIPLVFALWAIFKLWRNKLVKFATIVCLFFILSAVHGPITWLIKTFQIPLLDSTTPSRFISISIFFLIILAAFGFNDFMENWKYKKYIYNFLKFLLPIASIYAIFWIFAIVGQFVLEPRETWQVNLSVTRRNLIIPTAMFLSIPVGIMTINIIREKLHPKEHLLKSLFIIGIFIVTLYGGVFFSNKFLPVAPKRFIFPDHLLFNWLRDNAGIDRFYGGGTAHIDFNFPAHYRVYGAEGYDTLRFKRYAELLAASRNDGVIPTGYLRSDGVFPNEENGYRKRLFELLGVKYLLDKEDNPKTGRDWHYERFPNDHVDGFWQDGKFQVYKREPILPRAFLSNKYQVVNKDEEIIQKIYDPDFDLKVLILEEEAPLTIDSKESPLIIPEMIKYEPNEVIFKTDADTNQLLFLSDAYDDDWKVYIDKEKSKLLRTHYALRSVAVPKGSHQVQFKYEPRSFYRGLTISAVSVIGLIVFGIYFVARKNF